MVTTGADPQKEMKEIQLEGAAESGISGILGLMVDAGKRSKIVSAGRKKERELYNHYMADQVSEFYKGGQKRNE